MATKKDVHVVPHKDGWAVRTEGATRPAKVTPTQSKAIDAGRSIAKNNQSELIVHDQRGKIRSKDSFGSDPNPPRDREH